MRERENYQLIEKFYAAFAAKDYMIMALCYHADVEFEDPAFGKLKGVEASKMWEMLLTRSKDLSLTYSGIQASDTTGSAKWIATYTFSRTGNKVVNTIQAAFEFKDGKIVKHIDSFNFNAWLKSAFGWKGYLFIALPFLRKKFKQQARLTLTNYISKNP